MNIANTAVPGSQNLIWSIVEPIANPQNPLTGGLDNIFEVSWIDENPVSGTIAPGNNQNVQINIDGTGLTAGAYSCTLSVTSNDPDEDPVLIPVTLNVSALPINTPPVAVNDAASGREDLALQIDILANDYDTDGTLDSTTVAITGNPAHGQLNVDPVTGVVTYQPDLNYFGNDNFNYTVDDKQGATSNAATVQITVASVNDPPVLAGIHDVSFEEDSQTTLELNPYVSDVDHTVNQIDFLAEVIEAGMMLSPEKGGRNIEIDPSDLTISIDPGTHVATFSSSVDSSGMFSVVFTAVDDSGATDTDTISVTVTPMNDPPVISVLPAIQFPEDQIFDYAVYNWYPYVNDPETPGFMLNYDVIDGSHVSADCHVDSCYFSAPENWFGADTLYLVVSDGIAADTAQLFAHVTPVNDPPLFSNLMDSLLIPADSSANFCVWDYVADADDPDSALAYQFSATNGNLQLNYDPLTGDLTVGPNPGFSGMDVLHLEVWDDSSAYCADSIIVVIEVPLSLDNPFAENLLGSYSLKQNYPNPFNPVTHITFSLPKTEQVSLRVFNICGQQVATLINRQMDAGVHSIEFNGLNLASGLYFYKLETPGFVEIRKMIMMK